MLNYHSFHIMGMKANRLVPELIALILSHNTYNMYIIFIQIEHQNYLITSICMKMIQTW